MAHVPTVVSADAFDFSIAGFQRVLIYAQGTVPTSGWSEIRLAPRFYIKEPVDGIWDIDLDADAPVGLVLQVVQSVTASGLFPAPPWLKGIKVHGATNHVVASLTSGKKSVDATPMLAMLKSTRAGSVIYKRDLAVYDDSFQPIGFCSGFGSIKMKKLRHELTLTVEGPDEAKIRSCVERSIGAGLVAAIIAVYLTGGAALSAAISAFIASLESCLGEGFSVRIDDDSHWIKWCT